jgi:hypothetical protein
MEKIDQNIMKSKFSECTFDNIWPLTNIEIQFKEKQIILKDDKIFISN